MNFPDSVKSALNNFVNFEGRASRSEYWWFFLFYLIVYFAAIGIDVALGLGFVSLLVSLALLAPSLSVGARRLHDIGKSGWLQLLYIIPIIGLLVMIFFLVQPSHAGANRFGEPRE